MENLLLDTTPGFHQLRAYQCVTRHVNVGENTLAFVLFARPEQNTDIFHSLGTLTFVTPPTSHIRTGLHSLAGMRTDYRMFSRVVYMHIFSVKLRYLHTIRSSLDSQHRVWGPLVFLNVSNGHLLSTPHPTAPPLTLESSDPPHFIIVFSTNSQLNVSYKKDLTTPTHTQGRMYPFFIATSTVWSYVFLLYTTDAHSGHGQCVQHVTLQCGQSCGQFRQHRRGCKCKAFISTPGLGYMAKQRRNTEHL